jgi:hypothetical protein
VAKTSKHGHRKYARIIKNEIKTFILTDVAILADRNVMQKKAKRS